MVRRSYDQFCPLAFALDRVGERWTALILRDLAAGPKRYTDLLDGLPGIGTSVLALRLRGFEDNGLLRRDHIAPPTPATVYVLTEPGRALFRALLPLAAWGAQHMATAAPRAGETIPVASILMALQASFDPTRAAGICESYGFDVDGNQFTITVLDGKIEARTGTGQCPPDATVQTTSTTLFDVGFGRREATEAIQSGDMVVDGDPAALAHCHDLFGPNRLRTAEPSHRITHHAASAKTTPIR